VYDTKIELKFLYLNSTCLSLTEIILIYAVVEFKHLMQFIFDSNTDLIRVTVT
jgi:hypothetical protein